MDSPFIPNTNLMDAGYDYGAMFIVKDALCDGAMARAPGAVNPPPIRIFPLTRMNLIVETEN